MEVIVTDIIKTILLVEDESLTAMGEIRLLENEGFNVVHVSCGEKAIETVQNGVNIDMIIMDIDLGMGMDGTDAAEIILKSHDIPVVFFSCHEEKETIDKTKKIINYGYILKGSNETVILACIDMAFKLFEANENIRKAEEKLRQYQDIFNNMQVGLYIYHLEDIEDDRTLRMVAVNPASDLHTGVRIEDVIGKTLDENFPGLREKGIPQKYAEVVRSSKPIELDDIYYGDERVLENAFAVKAFPLPGNCVGVCFENVTKCKRVEAELAQSSAKIHDIFESISDAFLSLDTDLMITYFNAAAEKLLGKKRNDVIGIKLFDAFPELKGSIFEEKYTWALENKEFVNFETFFNIPPYVNWYDVRVYPMQYGISVYFQVVSDRKKADLNLQQQATIMQNISEAVIVTDMDFFITFWNEAAAKIYGYGKDEAIDREIDELLNTEFTGISMTEAHAILRQNGVWRGQIRQQNKKGEILYIEAIVSYLKDSFGNITGWITVNRDMTQLMNTEYELRKALSLTQQREQELLDLFEASKAVLQCHSFDATARKIFNYCRKATGAVSGYVALMSNDGKENEVLFLEAGGMPCNVDPLLPMPIRGLRADAYNKADVVYENDFMASQWVQFMPSGHVNLKNVMFAPLIINGKVVGVMGLANKPSDFTERDKKIASAYGDIASIALQRTLAEDKIKKLLAQKER